MKKTILLILILITALKLAASDDYEVGQKLFVWAKSGLNIRANAGTGYSIVDRIPFGEKVLVLEKTEFNYNVKAIDNPTNPLILKGNWVKIESKKGVIGFVIDQYLLSLKPHGKPLIRTINLQILEIDTIQKIKESEYSDGKEHLGTLKKIYERGIEELEDISGGMWFSNEYIYPDFSIEEVIVLFSSSWNDFDEFEIIRNWKNELIVSDGEVCTIKVKVKDQKIKVDVFCAAC